MKWRPRVPLAWKNLTHNPRRLAVALCGINFAVVLMFVQVGFRNALFDSTVQIVHCLNADIILASKAQYSLPAQMRFDRERLYQARGCEGVAAAYPLYVETPRAVWKQPGGKGHPIRTIACEHPAALLLLPGVAENAEALRAPDTALIDRASKRRAYAEPGSDAPLDQQQGVELCGRPLRLVGSFDMGTDFTSDGNLLMSTENFARYFPQRAAGKTPLQMVDLGVVQVVEGADPQVVKQRLIDGLPGDVLVKTKAELIDREINFWSRSTPIGFVFSLGTLIGFVVGVIICYQVIYADIADHLPEYATLKAMGYGNGYFVRVVLQEAFYLSVLSFIPGLVLSAAMYYAIARSTGLLMMLTLPRVAVVFGLTVAMCIASGALAMRKVLSADPADLY